MRLSLSRHWFTERSTIGELYVDGVWLCYTLEDCCRAEKIPGKTAIPPGTYKVTLTFSPRFGKVLPLLHSVPGFEGVRIHAGNAPEDTEGCILVGQVRDKDRILSSRIAMDEVLTHLIRGLNAGPVEIEIAGGPT